MEALRKPKAKILMIILGFILENYIKKKIKNISNARKQIV